MFSHALTWDVASTRHPLDKPMPSLRDSRIVGMPTRGLHLWLSNNTAPPFRARNTALAAEPVFWLANETLFLASSLSSFGSSLGLGLIVTTGTIQRPKKRTKADYETLLNLLTSQNSAPRFNNVGAVVDPHFI